MNLHIATPTAGRLSDADFRRLSQFIYAHYGIKMPDSKKNMLQARLQKRLRANQMTSYAEYCEMLFSEIGGQEVIHMIDVVSTNKTDFFREPGHFDFLRNQGLREALKNNHHLKIWSAGCSSGEEPYTLAMVLSEYEKTAKHFSYSILGTDISTSILQRAINAVYTEERVSGMPLHLKRSYLLRSKDPKKQLVRIAAELRSKVKFQRLNFMDHTYYGIESDFDIIFCRNVLIYFDKKTQKEVISRLCSHLKPGGYLFLGHSESIMDMKMPLRQLKPTIYQKIELS